MSTGMGKCQNYALCQNECQLWLLDVYNGRCPDCEHVEGVGGVPLPEVKENKGNIECPVCFDIPDVFIKFPPCTHHFCANCSRRLIFLDETKFEVSRVIFGCPPCPNGCQNPRVGRQCHCEEYEDIMKIWERDHPDHCREFEEMQMFVDDNLHDETIGRCPICRALLGFNDQAHR
jgi:hypothetical protein